jgi:hypothetical protein
VGPVAGGEVGIGSGHLFTGEADKQAAAAIAVREAIDYAPIFALGNLCIGVYLVHIVSKSAY